MAFQKIDDPNALQSPFNGTRVEGINNNGELVGLYSTGTVSLGFFEIGGVFTTLSGPPGSTNVNAYGVNDSGQIVGGYDTNTSGTHGFLYSNGSYSTIDDPNAGLTGTICNGINNLGQIVGEYIDGSGEYHGFRYAAGIYTTIDVPTATATVAEGINSAGEIVGYFKDNNNAYHGFTYTNGTYATFDDPQASGGTWGFGINDLGQIVGRYDDAGGQHGFRYSGGTFTTIDEPNAVVPGPNVNTVTRIQGINNAGQLAGFYFDDTSTIHGFQTISIPALNDFSGDGFSDMLWRGANGSLIEWQMNGGTIAGSGYVTYQGSVVSPDASWSSVATSDFNGDGHADMLWRNSNGTLALWQMNGSAIAASNSPTYQGNAVSPDASWNIAATADLTGDGKADILWRQNNGSLVLWSMNGSTVTSTDAVTYNGKQVAPDASWSVAGTGDFDGNGKADLLWRQSSSGALSVWSMDGATVKSGANVLYQGNLIRPDASWSVAAIGDFGGDGNADLLWRQSATGGLALWQMNGNTVKQSGTITSQGNVIAPDASWKIVEIGDFNGDGNSDILWRNDNGTMAEWLMNGSQITSSVVPSSQGSAVSPDASWNVQAKPTNFG